jgi:rhodanese-related sulfurtransferase
LRLGINDPLANNKYLTVCCRIFTMLEMTAAEAWAYLAQNPDAQLVDVRTRAEWHFVGITNLDDLDRQPILIEWVGADGTANPRFIEDLAAAVPADTCVLMLCRSGVRSLAAGNAALAAGYKSVINISDGFEGDLDAHQQRGHINGWRFSGLQWRQS